VWLMMESYEIINKTVSACSRRVVPLSPRRVASVCVSSGANKRTLGRPKVNSLIQ